MNNDRLFQVRVENVRFAAAHFATTGDACEPLHGHSYEVAAEIDGALSDNAWVIDFVELKSILRGLCKELDHRFLLQRESRVLKIEACESEWRVETASGRCYVMPVADVVALPVDNTTAERLSQWFCHRLWKALEEKGGDDIAAVKVEVWEGPGQRASYREERLPQG